MKIIIFSGFLGSGKTSVLLPLANQLTAQSKNVVIIENEIGDVGIDGSYLERDGLHVQELFGGCICCTLSVGLVDSISQIEDAYQPDTVIIEATGLARPEDLIQTIHQYVKRIDDIKTVTVVDAERYDVLRNTLTPLIEAQIQAADFLLLNKTDTVDRYREEGIVEDLKTINSTAKHFAISVIENRGIDGFLGAFL